MRVALMLRGLVYAVNYNLTDRPDWLTPEVFSGINFASEVLLELVADENLILADEIIKELRIAKYFG